MCAHNDVRTPADAPSLRLTLESSVPTSSSEISRDTFVVRAQTQVAKAALLVFPRGILENFPSPLRPLIALEGSGAMLLTVARATIEGSILAVFAKHAFTGHVGSWQLNMLVGLLGAAAELANIVSFFWTGLAQGKGKKPLIAGMLCMMMACAMLIALIPSGERAGAAGLWMLLAIALVGRVCWSGYITLRPTIWRANYPAAERTRIVGLVSGIEVLVIALVGAGMSFVLDKDAEAFRIILPLAACVGLLGVLCITKLPIRKEASLLAGERGHKDATMKPWQGPLVVVRVLKADPWYAQFMLWMFVLGFANLMVTPTLVISLKEELAFTQFQSVLVVSSVPLMVTVLSIPLWRKFLDRSHVVHFRAIHGWVFVLASVFYTIGALTDHAAWYFVGAACMGVGFGGGSMAWNLGHVDFARPSETSRYMATHVTLNGIRGLIAPLAVTLSYESLKAAGKDAHLWVQVAGLVLSVAGALGFVHLRWRMGTLAAHKGPR
jgi:MFS family permease